VFQHKEKMVLMQKKAYRLMADVGTDPLDGDSMVRPVCEDAVVGSVVGAGSRGDHPQLPDHAAAGVTIRRYVSHVPHS